MYTDVYIIYDGGIHLKPQQPRTQARATQNARNTTPLKTILARVKYTQPLADDHTAGGGGGERRRGDADVFMATLRCMTDGMSAEILVEFHFLRPHRT